MTNQEAADILKGELTAYMNIKLPRNHGKTSATVRLVMHMEALSKAIRLLESTPDDNA